MDPYFFVILPDAVEVWQHFEGIVSLWASGANLDHLACRAAVRLSQQHEEE